MPDNIVEVESLSRRFEHKVALDSISFEVLRGRTCGLVGTNGAGKTTLIKHLLGLLRAQSGFVRVFDLDPVRYPAKVLKRIGYLSEGRDLPEWMSVSELMRYTQAFHPNWDSNYAEALLRDFNLDPKKKIKELSQGMRAQAGLVAAVAHRPDLLLLDEPSSGLDAVVREDILDAIVQTVAEEGRTVIFSSHLLEEVERMSDDVIMIDQGRIILNGRLENILHSHQHTRIQFAQPLKSPPSFSGSLSVSGDECLWNIVHQLAPEDFNNRVSALNGHVLESRSATLQEIFVARANRRNKALEAESN